MEHEYKGTRRGKERRKAGRKGGKNEEAEE